MISFMKKIKLLFLLILTFIVFSCGIKYSGWGVLYVDDEEYSLSAGTIYPITQVSEIRNVYSIKVPNSKTILELPKWKISFFKKKEDAEKFAAEYKKWIPLYAKCTLNGLSIREQANINSDRIYKLKEGQELKIIKKTDKSENIANHKGYWYIVLTEDGTMGFCFDKNLTLYDITKGKTAKTDNLNKDLLNEFLKKQFRQTYYIEMINDQTIDLSKFKINYGIFSYPEKNEIVISKPNHDIVFEYTNISQNNSGRFIFEGTSLQIEVRSKDRIVAYYNYENKEYAELMVYIEDLEQIIHDEKEKRLLLINKFEDMKKVSSKAYGKISFPGGNKFSWYNYNLLVPNVVPENSGNNGTISIRYPITSNLKNDYDGVVSFNFNNNSLQNINFLFKFSELGIKLVYVPSSDVNNNFVKHVSDTPLIIFMSAAGE